MSFPRKNGRHDHGTRQQEQISEAAASRHESETAVTRMARDRANTAFATAATPCPPPSLLPQPSRPDPSLFCGIAGAILVASTQGISLLVAST
eukprot:gene10068-biopygen7701